MLWLPKMAYRQYIKQLLLLSPIDILQRLPGFNYFEDRNQKRAEKAHANGKKPQTMPSMFMTMAKYRLEKKISPFDLHDLLVTRDTSKECTDMPR
jgi:hypothetical protein